MWAKETKRASLHAGWCGDQTSCPCRSCSRRLGTGLASARHEATRFAQIKNARKYKKGAPLLNLLTHPLCRSCLQRKSLCCINMKLHSTQGRSSNVHCQEAPSCYSDDLLAPLLFLKILDLEEDCGFGASHFKRRAQSCRCYQKALCSCAPARLAQAEKPKAKQ